jgi:hypothetical protein
MVKSKITKAEFKRTSEWQGKNLHDFWVETEAGDKGFLTVTDKFKEDIAEGKELQYEKEVKDKKDGSGTYTKLKRVSDQPFSPGGRGRQADPKTMIVAYAKDIMVARLEAIAHMSNDMKMIGSPIENAIEITDMADALLAWYEGKKKVETTITEKPTVTEGKPVETEDELPF